MGCCFCAYVDEVSDDGNQLDSCEVKKQDTRATKPCGLADWPPDVEAPEALLCFSDSRLSLTPLVSGDKLSCCHLPQCQ